CSAWDNSLSIHLF
nr:immunoglobulin light chain junction region [Macaca mulatta]